MNYFPDPLVSTQVSFVTEGNIFDTMEGDGTLTFKVVMGKNEGYEAILYYNGRLLIGFQELENGQNERLDFEWDGGSAQATAINGQLHELKCDSNSNVVAWSIKGLNSQGEYVVLRYLRNFFDENNVLTSAIRYEEHDSHCNQIYQFFQYGLDTPDWKARKAWTYIYPYLAGAQAYYDLEIPVDILEFPSVFEDEAVEVRQVNI